VTPAISYATAHRWEALAKAKGVSAVARSSRGFMRAYERAGTWDNVGDYWRRRREAFLARHLAQVRQQGEALWRRDRSGKLQPSRRCLALIMWAYMPPQRNPGGRAKAGGEYGVNKEWYEGGKFLPSRADRAKQAPPAYLRGGRRAEIEPGVWAPVPGDWMVPLWQTVKQFVDHQHMRRTGELRVEPSLTFGPNWGYMPKAEIERRLAALMAGYRWEIVEQAPENAGKLLKEDGHDNPPRPGAVTIIESPSGLDRYHYQLLGGGRIERTKYEGDMQGRSGDWHRLKPQILSFDAAKAHYRHLVNDLRWSRV
jgi:hypothetical protein